MASEHTRAIAERATALYEQRLRGELESRHRDMFVAIEPDSGDYFLGSTFGESVLSARAAHPDCVSFVIRIGHDAAIHLGAISN